MLRRLFTDDKGSNALEYGLIVGLISLAIVTGATAAGGALGTIFNAATTEVTTVAAGITN
jgi:pilus assembly protein Flp/PilA